MYETTQKLNTLWNEMHSQQKREYEAKSSSQRVKNAGTDKKKRLDDNEVKQEALDFELFRKDLESFRTQFAKIERYSEE